MCQKLVHRPRAREYNKDPPPKEPQISTEMWYIANEALKPNGEKVDYLITLPNNLLWTYKNDIVLSYVIQKICFRQINTLMCKVKLLKNYDLGKERIFLRHCKTQIIQEKRGDMDYF